MKKNTIATSILAAAAVLAAPLLYAGYGTTGSSIFKADEFTGQLGAMPRISFDSPGEGDLQVVATGDVAIGIDGVFSVDVGGGSVEFSVDSGSTQMNGTVWNVDLPSDFTLGTDADFEDPDDAFGMGTIGGAIWWDNVANDTIFIGDAVDLDPLITIDGNAGTVALAGDTWGVSEGGTGASDAVTARANLGITDNGVTENSFWGNGRDGNVTLGANTTLATDMYYNNLDLAGFTLAANQWRVFVAGTLTGNSGRITGRQVAVCGGSGKAGCPGNAAGAGGSAGGSTGIGAALGGGNTGAAGGAGGTAAGSAGATSTQCTGSAFWAGGKGGGVSAGTTGDGGSGSGGAGGNSGVNNAITNNYRAGLMVPTNTDFADWLGGVYQLHLGGCGGGGGGGGGGDGTAGAGGGGGGAGEGIVLVHAKAITGTVTIDADGGPGGLGATPAAGNRGGGGGGNGGGGGFLHLVYGSKSGTVNISAAGGTAGAGGSGSGTGTSGFTGENGLPGTCLIYNAGTGAYGTGCTAP